MRTLDRVQLHRLDSACRGQSESKGLNSDFLGLNVLIVSALL